MTEHPRSPRDWLLDRYRSAEPRLDDSRAAVLANLPQAEPVSVRSIARELFLPNRFVWATLAVVWLALLGFHASLARSAVREPSIQVPTAAIAEWLAHHNTHDSLAHLD